MDNVKNDGYYIARIEKDIEFIIQNKKRHIRRPFL